MASQEGPDIPKFNRGGSNFESNSKGGGGGIGSSYNYPTYDSRE